ncbi:MAG: DNA repair protein RecN [Lachnospiraceae bacterium]|nr:DNA repair protein RecN [Lachnospiraceae bacterium]
MLKHIYIKNVALVDEVELELDKGLNILTGETGAGKSVIIGSLLACIGGKADKDFIKASCDEAKIELTFDCLSKELNNILEQNEISTDDELVLSRKIQSSGKSVFRANGEIVTQKLVKEIAGYLIDIYGQHEHHSLLSEKTHLKLLDEFGGETLDKTKQRVREAYRVYSDLRKKCEGMQSPEELLKDKELICFEYEQLDNAALCVGEDEILQEKYDFYEHSKQIRDGLDEAVNLICGGDGDSLSQVRNAILALGRIESFDSSFTDIKNALYDAESILEDSFRELDRYLDRMDEPSDNIEQIAERLDLINKLKVRYGKTIPDILDYFDELKVKKESIDNYDIYKAQAEAKRDEAFKEYLVIAKELTTERKKAAEKLSEAMIESLQDLNFLEVKFEFRFEECEPSDNGVEKGQFFISTNPGQPLKELIKVSSGGELSRIMLGFKTVIASKDDIPTMIFDEIDTGISGKTAACVSRKISELSENHQIICITHLPQIAAAADKHFKIAKNVTDMTTQTNVFSLSEEESVRELAGMMGGTDISSLGINAASELKKQVKRK